jgi:type II secretory pathway component PulF
MLQNTLLGLGPFVVLITGVVLLWYANARQRARKGLASWAVMAVSAAGWVLVIVGLFALVAITTHVVMLLGWIVVAVVLFSIASRYRWSEQRSLLWALMAAAERGIPLESSARAFAEERAGLLGWQAANLADYLEAGLPLGLALRRAGIGVPAAVQLAADLGQQTNTLGPALRKSVGQVDEFTITLRSTFEKFFYLVFLVLFGTATLTFLMLKIIPIFRKIFEEFGLELPPVTILLIGISDFFVTYWFLALPFVLIVGFFFLGYLLYYMGWLSRALPGNGFLLWRVDCALVMRWLALAVREKWSLSDTFRKLAAYFPDRTLRDRLVRAAGRADLGIHWCDCLQRARIVRRTDGVLLKSAERVGNLAWALDEIADSSLRRAAYRLRAMVSLAFPAFVLLFGGCVFFVAVAVLGPLLMLIIGLT